MRENHYAVSCINTKSFSGFQLARRITLLLFPKCRVQTMVCARANLIIIIHNSLIAAQNLSPLQLLNTI